MKFFIAAASLLAVASAAPAGSFTFPAHARYQMEDCKSNDGHTTWSQIAYWGNPKSNLGNPTEVGRFPNKVTWNNQSHSVFTATQQLIAQMKDNGQSMLGISDNHGGAQAWCQCTKDGSHTRTSGNAKCTVQYVCTF